MLSKYADSLSIQVKVVGDSAKEYLYFTTTDLTLTQRIITYGSAEYLQLIIQLPDSFSINDVLAKEITYISLSANICYYKNSSDYIPYKRFVNINTVCKSGNYSNWGKYSNYISDTPTTDNKNQYMYQNGGDQIYSYILNDKLSSSASQITNGFTGITKENWIYYNVYSSSEDSYKPSTLIDSSETKKIWTYVYIAF